MITSWIFLPICVSDFKVSIPDFEVPGKENVFGKHIRKFFFVNQDITSSKGIVQFSYTYFQNASQTKISKNTTLSEYKHICDLFINLPPKKLYQISTIWVCIKYKNNFFLSNSFETCCNVTWYRFYLKLIVKCLYSVGYLH